MHLIDQFGDESGNGAVGGMDIPSPFVPPMRNEDNELVFAVHCNHFFALVKPY